MLQKRIDSFAFFSASHELWSRALGLGFGAKRFGFRALAQGFGFTVSCGAASGFNRINPETPKPLN